MLRAALISLALALPLGGAVARAQRIPAPPLRAALMSCRTGPEPADRYAVFSASMPGSDRAARMWLRFDLYLRRPGHRLWHHLDVPKWGLWQKSAPGVPGLVAAKRVDALAPPASYRAFVRFRWYDDSGRIVRSARRITRVCRQPDPRPDLELGAVSATPAGPETARYAVVVRNTGQSAAGPFALALTAGDAEQPATPVDGLAAGDERPVTIEGPRCAPGGTIGIALDPENMVDEVHEPAGPVIRPCPPGARG